jgi:glycosyltransferase involved in cell wall biosynthesis
MTRTVSFAGKNTHNSRTESLKSEKMPNVSVVIPTFNREKYVTRAIESVLGQKYHDYELIVVDDGSTDNTKEKLRTYGETIKYIYQDNSGVSASRNRGIQSATGEWLAFLDSDDEWSAGYLDRQMRGVHENPGVCMQTTDCLFIGLNGDTRRYFEINRSIGEFHGKDYLYFEKPFRFVVKHGPWQIGSTIILREAINKAGLFDTNLTISEDFDLMARVALQGAFGMINGALIRVYRRDESIACLTGRAKDDPIGAKESDERIYQKLIQIQTLSNKERKALKELLSANRRAIGNMLLEQGKPREARKYYEEAVFIYPSIASLGKYALSFLSKKSS